MKVYAPALGRLLVSLLLTLSCFSLQALAQEQKRDMQKETTIVNELQKISPASVEDFKAGTAALDAEHFTEAVKYYEKVYLKAPKWDVINRRLGSMLVLTGNPESGLAMLRDAVELKRSPENLSTLAQSYAFPGKDKEGSVNDKRRALELIREAWAMNPDKKDYSYAGLTATLALQLDDRQTFRVATRELVAKAPQLAETHYFNAVRALMDEDWTEADREIQRAKELGLPQEAVSQFLATGVHTRALARRSAYLAVFVVCAWAGGMALLFVTGGILSKRTLRYIETTDPNSISDPVHQFLRTFYRLIVNAAGIYYYISIPIVIGLSLAVVAGVLYGIFYLGVVAIKLELLLVLGALVTCYQMVRALFVKRNIEDPGRELYRDEAPGLWGLAEDVAHSVGTRPVNEIRVTPGTELAVYERGSLRERMKDEAARVLIIGVGLLKDFKQSDLRAVLAHEYGHFLNRDTAGGDLAMRVKAHMAEMARGMIYARQNTRWNLGFRFLIIYHKLFTRISHGASRLQEVLADRLSAYHYGAQAFEDGLRHVVYREAEFSYMASCEVKAALGAKRSFANFYELVPSEAPQEQKSIQAKYQEAITRVTSETDTHPNPIDRFRYVGRVMSKPCEPAPGMVWDLFSDRQALTAEMHALLENNIRARTV